MVGLAREFLPLPPALPAPEAERRQGDGRADQPAGDMSLWRGVIAGLVGGTIAAGTMSAVNRGLTEIGVGARQAEGPRRTATGRQREGCRRHRAPAPSSFSAQGPEPLAGNLVHYAFGASVGAYTVGSPPLCRASRRRLDCRSASPCGSARTSSRCQRLASQSPRHGGLVHRRTGVRPASGLRSRHRVRAPFRPPGAVEPLVAVSVTPSSASSKQ